MKRIGCNGQHRRQDLNTDNTQLGADRRSRPEKLAFASDPHQTRRLAATAVSREAAGSRRIELLELILRLACERVPELLDCPANLIRCDSFHGLSARSFCNLGIRGCAQMLMHDPHGSAF